MTLSLVHVCHLLLCQHCTCVHFRRALESQAKRCFDTCDHIGHTIAHSALNQQISFGEEDATTVLGWLSFLSDGVVVSDEQPILFVEFSQTCGAVQRSTARRKLRPGLALMRWLLSLPTVRLPRSSHEQD